MLFTRKAKGVSIRRGLILAHKQGGANGGEIERTALAMFIVDSAEKHPATSGVQHTGQAPESLVTLFDRESKWRYGHRRVNTAGKSLLATVGFDWMYAFGSGRAHFVGTFRQFVHSSDFLSLKGEVDGKSASDGHHF